jgi:tetratricopeptide (TPR) repeat protein
MTRRILVLALAAALSAPVAGFSQTAVAAAPAKDAAPKDLAAEVERLRVEGFNAVFSLDYAAAAKAFDEIVRIAPERPQGYLYRATNTWFKSLYDQRLLSTSLYSQDDFYAQKEKRPNPAVDKAFRADIARAISVAEANIKTNPKDVDSLYYLGAAHGALGGYEASVARAFLSALKHGNKSVDLHEKVLKLDPKYNDAYMTVGVYHYVVGSLPFAVKVLVALGGVKGSRKDGLVEIERAAKAGLRVGDDARVILVGLYAREKRLEESLAVLRELRAKYPANYVISIEEANTLVQLKRYDEAYAAFDRILANSRAAGEAKDYVSYSYGEALKRGGKFERALAAYGQVWAFPKADPDLVTLARLGAGEAHDALGQRKEALASYEVVLKREDVLDSRRKAGQYKKEPYSPSSPMASTGQL